MERNTTRPLSPGHTYHFHIIYNYARCPLSTTADTQLSLAWTQRAADILSRQGMDSGYYHDRDCPRGQSMVTELTQVIKASQVTVVLLSPGFVRDCWPRYWLLSSFRSLFESPAPSSVTGASPPAPFSSSGSGSASYSSAASSRSSAAVSSPSAVSASSGGPGCSEVILVSLGVGREDLPAVLRDRHVLFFPQHWQHDSTAWSAVEGALGLTPSSVQCLEERSEGDITRSSEASLHSSPSQEHSPGATRHHSLLLSQGSQSPPHDTLQGHQKTVFSEDYSVSADSHHYQTSDIHNGKVRRRAQPGFPGPQRHTGYGAEDQCDGVGESQTVKESKTPRTEEAGDSREVESAVLQRLCHTGLRRESVEESTITRVFVHGNTVAIDTLRSNGASPQPKTPSPRACGNPLTAPALAADRCGKDRGSLTPSAADSTPGFSFTHHRHVDTNSAGSQPSALSSDPTLSTQSPRRKLQYSEEYGHSSDPSYSISLTTEDCERLSASQRSDKLDGVWQTQMVSRVHRPAEESFRTSTPAVPHQEETVYATHQQTVASAYSSRTTSSIAGGDNVDSSASSMASNKVTTAAAHSEEQNRVSQTSRPQLSAQTVYAEDVSPRRNQVQGSGYTATIQNSGRDAENQHQRPYEDNKPQLPQSGNPTQAFRESVLSKETPHRKEAEEAMFKQKAVETTSQSSFVTSIEDEQDMVMNDLSESWSPSEYGTISPPHDLSSASQDSGFLSSGLTSFRHTSSINDSKSRKQDVHHSSGFVEDSRSSAVKSADTNTLYTKNADAKSPNPPVCDQFTKSSYHEEIKSDLGFLEKSSMTKTSMERDMQTLETWHQCQTGDRLADPLAESLTVKQRSQHSGSVAAQQSSTAEAEARQQNMSSGHYAGQAESRKDGVLCGTQSARASRATEADSHRVLNRRESWIYVDLDKGWTLTYVILPLYRILCYALSTPELPYF